MAASLRPEEGSKGPCPTEVAPAGPGEARLPGICFKLLVGGLITAETLFPDIKQQVDAMEPYQLYPWADYVEMARRIAAQIAPRALVRVGARIMGRSKEPFVSRGFDSAEKILADWSEVFLTYIIGAPPQDRARTEEYQPGQVIILSGAAQPGGLVEGYLRGVVEMFGGTVTSFAAEEVTLDGYPYHRLKMTWR